MTETPRALDDGSRACLQETTPRPAQVLACVLERWTGLTDAQRAWVYTLVEQLHRTSAMRRASRALIEGA